MRQHGSERQTAAHGASAAPGVGRRIAGRSVAVVVLLALAAAAYRLVLAPVHGVRDAAGCARAYAEARTHGDTLSVDYLSYPDLKGRGGDRRCGVLRSATAWTLPR